MGTKTAKFKITATIVSIVILLVSVISFVYLSIITYRTTPVEAYNTIVKDKIYSYNKNVIFSTKNGELYLSRGEEAVIIYKTSNDILSIKCSDEFVAVAEDNRAIVLLDLNGKVKGTFKSNYQPVNIAVDNNGNVGVAGRMTALKNQIEVFSSSGSKIYSEKVSISTIDLYINGNYVYVLNGSALVIRIDAAKGSRKSYSLSGQPTASFYNPISKKIIVGDVLNNVYCLSEEISLDWKINSSNDIYSITGDITNNEIFIANRKGNINIYNGDGKSKGQTILPSEVTLLNFNKGNNDAIVRNVNNLLFRYDYSTLTKLNSIKIFRVLALLMLIISAIALLICIVSLRFKKLYESIFIKSGKIAQKIYKSRIAYFIILPSILLLSLFCYYPAISGLFLAFFDYKPDAYMRWVGLKNFFEVLGNSYFWTGFGNMLILLLTDIIKSLIPSIIFAEIILAMKSKGAQYWTRVALYLPGILPGIAGLLVWTNGILGQDGLINSILIKIGLPHFAQSWLGNEQTALGAIIFIGFPWIGSYILFYGALIGLPSTLFEASKIDGCGWFKRIVKIDIPLISPQMKYVFITTFIGSIQDFGRIYMTTQGGPGHATYTPMLELYYNMSKFQNYGVASAIGILMFIIIFIPTLLNLRLKTQGAYE